MSSYAIVKDPAGTPFGYRPGRPYIEDEHGEHHFFTHEKFGFWHPSLPKVQSVGAVGVFAMTTESVAPSWPFGTWRKVTSCMFSPGYFWHPDLPEIEVNPPKRFGPTAGVPGEITCALKHRPSWGRSLAVSLLLLALAAPALAQNQPCKVNVAIATPAELAFLIQTGPVLAGRISEAKPADLAALDAVKGVGVKWLEYNREHVAFAGETTCTAKLSKPKPVSATGETESDTVRRGQDGAR